LKGVWAVPVIIGIALMLGILSVPAFADKPENVCIIVPPPQFQGEEAKCRITPVVGQHLFIIFPSPDIQCHADVFFIRDNQAFVLLVHGPRATCSNFQFSFSFEVIGQP